MSRNVLYVIILGFICGVLWRSFFDLGDYFLLFLLVLATGVSLLAVLWQRKEYFLITLFTFAAILGVARFDISDAHQEVFTEGEYVNFQGIVVSEPDVRETNIKYTIRLLESKEKILLTTDRYTLLLYGDVVSIAGNIAKPEDFETDSGRIFRYENYLAKDGIYYQIFYPKVEKVGEGEGNRIKAALFSLKKNFLEKIEKVIPDPEAALLGGLVVGAKQSLGTKLQEDFRKTGLIHIVVLSGYNMTIIASSVLKSLFFLPLIASLSVGAVAIIFFAIMTGASATIVRASIMAILALVARATGRKYAINRALFLAGFFMVLQNPKILAFDPSFQLSFIATLGLIHVSPVIERKVSFIPEKFGIREVVIATISTQIFVLPFILYLMGQFSLVALPANLLVLMFVPATMLFGFLTGAIGFISTTLSFPFAWVTHAFLAYELFIVELFAKLPFASFTIGQFPFLIVLIVYLGYGLCLYLIQSRKE